MKEPAPYTKSPEATRQMTPVASKPGASAHSSVHPLLQLQRSVGNQAVQQFIQAKLTISQPNDPYEQEADKIADQVMATPAHTGISGAPPHIQRFSGHSNGQMEAAPASVDRALASPGRPLEPVLRQDMEQRFGHDFSRVRVYTGAAAEQSAADMNAHAYTVGQNIVFGPGQFTLATSSERRLVAHELTHVVQQEQLCPLSSPWAGGRKMGPDPNGP